VVVGDQPTIRGKGEFGTPAWIERDIRCLRLPVDQMNTERCNGRVRGNKRTGIVAAVGQITTIRAEFEMADRAVGDWDRLDQRGGLQVMEQDVPIEAVAGDCDVIAVED